MVTQLNFSKLEELFRENGVPLSQTQLRQFEIYHKEILKWNPKANLISKNDESCIFERHFLESALLCKLSELNGGLSVLDLGTGGGFPGLPLKIVNPQLQVTLLDSKRWKGLFLKQLLEQLQLGNVEVVTERAEVAGKEQTYSNRFDRIVSRAVTELNKLYALSEAFLKPAGKLITIKGSSVNEELNRIKFHYPNLKIEMKSISGPKENRKRDQRIVIIG